MTSSTTEFQRNPIFGFANARSCMIFDARSSSRRCTTVTVRRELGEEQRLFDRGVAATDDADLLLLEEEAVAGRAGGDAVAQQPLLVRQPEHLRRRAGRDDDRPGRVLVGADGHGERRAGGEVHPVGVGGDELGPEALGLLAEPLHEVRAHDPLGEARVVLDLGREHQLPTGGEALDHDRPQVRARGVDRRGQPGRAGTHDDDISQLRHSRHPSSSAVSSRTRRR